MKDGDIQLVAALGAMVVSCVLIGPIMYFTDATADTGPIIDDRESIEASLAYKTPNAPKQPQKPKRAPDPEVKPEGVSRDENKKVDDKKVDKTNDEKPSKDTDPLAKFRRRDEDLEPGKTDDREGASDGSLLGRGNISKGDPYFQRLWADLDWSVPELAKTGGLETIGCVVFTADGKISATSFRSKGDDDVATLAESAIRALKAKRDAAPEVVPTHLLQRLTGKGICFNLTAK